MKKPGIIDGIVFALVVALCAAAANLVLAACSPVPVAVEGAVTASSAAAESPPQTVSPAPSPAPPQEFDSDAMYPRLIH